MSLCEDSSVQYHITKALSVEFKLLLIRLLGANNSVVFLFFVVLATRFPVALKVECGVSNSLTTFAGGCFQFIIDKKNIVVSQVV